MAQQEAAQAEADKARLAAQDADRLRQKAETEKAELRAQLLRQFNAILETRDTARGLIVNMSDVLFDTGKYTLRPGAREKLARVGGIISGHPGLRLEVEGHTDSVGGDDYNQTTLRAACRIGARLSGPARTLDEFGHGERIWQDSARGFKRNRGWAPAKSARGVGGLGRGHWCGD